MSLYDILEGKSPVLDTAPDNELIRNTMRKAAKMLLNYKKPVCAISGGSDSDIILDLLERVRCGTPITYVFYDTGIEYQASKDHLKYLEDKYNIEIVRRRAVKAVPFACKEYGLPFMSKLASDYIYRLQSHGFQFEDEPFEVLYKKYPNCKIALQWWCNESKKEDGKESRFCISRLKGLKEFMVANPPDFPISDKCCLAAKKRTKRAFIKEIGCCIEITGERRAEGGIRATAHTSCFSDNVRYGVPKYMPIYFWTDEDKKQYKEHYGIKYSDCYEVWGMHRTGCAGCPFGTHFEDELEIIHKYEPKLELAVNNIFGKSYEYTRAYREFKSKLSPKKDDSTQETIEGF